MIIPEGNWNKEEIIAFKQNEQEDTDKKRKWAKGLTIEKVKLYLFKNPFWLTRKEFKVLEREYKRRRKEVLK